MDLIKLKKEILRHGNIIIDNEIKEKYYFSEFGSDLFLISEQGQLSKVVDLILDGENLILLHEYYGCHGEFQMKLNLVVRHIDNYSNTIKMFDLYVEDKLKVIWINQTKN